MSLLPYQFIVNPPYTDKPLVIIKSTEGMWTFSGLTNLVNPAMPSSPTGVGSGTGGTIAAGNNYARIVALNSSARSIGLESSVVVTTGTTSSIVWTWPAVSGATSYLIYCATTSGSYSFYFTSATNSFTQTLPATSGTAGTLLSGIGVTPLAPSGTPVGSGGNLVAGSNYAKVTAIDSNGFITNASIESAVVTTTVNNSSITWTWPAVTGAVFYQLWVSQTTGTEASYFKTNTNSYTQVFATGTTDTIPTTNGSVNRVTNANYPVTTLPGVVFLDAAFYVMTPTGRIFGSALEDPTTWTALNVVTAEGGSGIPMALQRHQSYILAFTDANLQVFYDAANPAPGSPLSPASNMFFEVGCASGTSIVSIKDTTIFMSKTKQRGRAISLLSGMSMGEISDDVVNRILNLDDLSTVYSFGIRISGHDLYVLTLVKSNVTLVFDMVTKMWHIWSSNQANSSLPVTSITYSNGIATATVNIKGGHGLLDGDPVIIAGADQTAYNGTFNITYINSTQFSYPVTGTPVTPATGTITYNGYSEGYFEGIYYTNGGSIDLIQDVANGRIYGISPQIYQDQNGYINTLIRTLIHDLGTTERKTISRLEMVGDKVASNMLVRYSDDDYSTYSLYRPADLSVPRSIINRLGAPHRRSFDFRHTANTPVRVEAAELDIDN